MAKLKMIIMMNPPWACLETGEEVFEIIARVSHIGIPIFFVEQNLRKALSIADRGYILNGGQIVLHDSRKSFEKSKCY
jgi:branched-chain amino acid transport system ATP-binding protein